MRALVIPFSIYDLYTFYEGRTMQLKNQAGHIPYYEYSLVILGEKKNLRDES